VKKESGFNLINDHNELLLLGHVTFHQYAIMVLDHQVRSQVDNWLLLLGKPTLRIVFI